MENTQNTPLKVFITGGTTDVGREATRILANRGHHVAATAVGSANGAVVRKNGGLPVYPDLYRAGELRSAMLVNKADVVIHLAAGVPHRLPQRYNDLAETNRLRVEGTKAVLEAGQAVGVKYIVLLSSALLYGDAHGGSVDEQSSIAGSDAFGYSDDYAPMAEAEDLVLHSGIPAGIVRAATIYSAYSTVMQSLRDHVGRSLPESPGRDHNALSVVHAADVALLCALLAEKQLVGEIFNAADDHPTTQNAFVDQFAHSLGLMTPSRASSLIPVGGFTEFQKAVLSFSTRVSSEKAKNVLGWKPRFASYREGLDDTLLSWRAEQPMPV